MKQNDKKTRYSKQGRRSSRVENPPEMFISLNRGNLLDRCNNKRFFHILLKFTHVIKDVYFTLTSYKHASPTLTQFRSNFAQVPKYSPIKHKTQSETHSAFLAPSNNIKHMEIFSQSKLSISLFVIPSRANTRLINFISKTNTAKNPHSKRIARNDILIWIIPGKAGALSGSVNMQRRLIFRISQTLSTNRALIKYVRVIFKRVVNLLRHRGAHYSRDQSNSFIGLRSAPRLP